jgi:hypothetical protein
MVAVRRVGDQPSVLQVSPRDRRLPRHNMAAPGARHIRVLAGDAVQLENIQPLELLSTIAVRAVQVHLRAFPKWRSSINKRLCQIACRWPVGSLILGRHFTELARSSVLTDMHQHGGERTEERAVFADSPARREKATRASASGLRLAHPEARR